MGCDIHLHVERRDEEGKWVFEDVREYPPEIAYASWDKDKRWPRWYHGRNYACFAILANVRNGYGFAGVPTGEGYKHMADPRGLPDDVSEAVQTESIEWGMDGHSHSWFTLAELQAYDMNQGTVRFGVISLGQYKAWDRNGAPPGGWSGAVSGADIQTISMPQADEVLEKYPDYPAFEGDAGAVLGIADTDGEKINGARLFVAVQWRESYADAAPDFVRLRDVVLPAVVSKRGLASSQDVRAVFWFDN